MNAFGELELQGAVFDDGSQYVCNSLLPNPLLPVSNAHFVLSIVLFAAPLNSSHHCVVQLTEPVRPVVPHCAMTRSQSRIRVGAEEREELRVGDGRACQIHAGQ